MKIRLLTPMMPPDKGRTAKAFTYQVRIFARNPNVTEIIILNSRGKKLKTLWDHVSKRYPIVFPFRYILDCYYSWGKLDFYKKKTEESPFFLDAQSDAWKRLQRYIPVNRYWLEMIREHNYIRYEDWLVNKKLNMEKMRRALPGIDESVFMVEENKNRLYYQGNYRDKMDREVFDYLRESFADSIRFFWPEKLNDTY